MAAKKPTVDAPDNEPVARSTVSKRWQGTVTALSSIAHGGITAGTATLLRREKFMQPDGDVASVPLVSGNALRGLLRRTSEELFREHLRYEGEISLPVAWLLRGGGSLTKVTGDPLSGAKLRRVRQMLPHIGLFGGCAQGRTIDGALHIGKLVPLCSETAHVAARSGYDTSRLVEVAQMTQIETYTRSDDILRRDMIGLASDGASLDALDDTESADEVSSGQSMQFRYSTETFIAGSQFSSWMALNSATALEASYFDAVIARFMQNPRVGGRSRQGLGQIAVDWTETITHGSVQDADWAGFLAEHRDECVELLRSLG